jgi:peptidoglycan hydrolase-like protein with peptidoglycan-binding domain
MLRLGKWYDGPLNGVYTPAVTESVRRFQQSRHLTPNGVASLAVIHALQHATGQAGLKPRYLDPAQNLPVG